MPTIPTWAQFPVKHQSLLNAPDIVWEVLRSAMHILDMYYNIHCQIDIELLLAHSEPQRTNVIA